MSARVVRKPIRTYSRLNKRSLSDEEPATKRRRVESSIETVEEEDTVGNDVEKSATTLTAACAAEAAPTSCITTACVDGSSAPPPFSPKECAAIFSDELLRSTPPSSPNPPQSSPPVRTRRSMFSIFKRRSEPAAPTTKPLSERSPNAQSPPQPRPKKKRLVQMQLDLVGELRKTCKVCGMEYIPSNAEDATLHRKFHAMNVGGVDFTKAFAERLKQNQVWSGADGSFIAVIGRKDALALRNKSSEVLKVVNTELAAVSISEEQLWSQIRSPDSENAAAISGGQVEAATKGRRALSTSDRFKVYLYIRSNKCVGACLAERIQEAFPVQDQDDAAEPTGQLPSAFESSSVSIGTVANPAILGISRIWASNLHRKQGIATRMLDVARSDFLYGMTIEKGAIAFSQPTESGGQLARKWFGRRAGWHVYID